LKLLLLWSQALKEETIEDLSPLKVTVGEGFWCLRKMEVEAQLVARSSLRYSFESAELSEV
jgi:hypothetical protein